MKRLAESCNAELENGSYRLVHWDLSDGNANINQVIEELNQSLLRNHPNFQAAT